MKILTRLGKKTPTAEALITAELLAALKATPRPWQNIASRVHRSLIPTGIPAGVVIRTILGKLCDDGKAVETFVGTQPVYALAPHFARVFFKAVPMQFMAT